MEKKQKRLTIIAVITLVALVAGATYAYFQVGTSNLFGTSTINATAEDVGSVVLRGNNATLSMNLTAADMMRGNDDITYYASSNGKTTVETEETIGVATVSPSTDTNIYHCTYDLNITHSGTNDMYDRFWNVGEEKTATGDMYGIKYGEYDTQALCEEDNSVDIQDGFGSCEQFDNKYSLVFPNYSYSDVYLYSSLSECEAGFGRYDENDCFKKYESGDTYMALDVPYNNYGTEQVVLIINGEEYDWSDENNMPAMPSTVSGEFDIANPQEIAITAGLKFVNSSDIDQTALAGTDVTISITASNLSCTAIGLDTEDLESNNVELAVENTQTNMSIGNSVSGLSAASNEIILNDLTIRNDEYTINKLAVSEQYKYYATPSGKATTETLVPIATIESNNNLDGGCVVNYQIVTIGNMLEAVQELDSDTILDLSIYTDDTLYETYDKDSYPSTITIPVNISANSSVTLKSKLELSRTAEESDIESLYDTSIKVLFIPTSMSCNVGK